MISLVSGGTRSSKVRSGCWARSLSYHRLARSAGSTSPLRRTLHGSIRRGLGATAPSQFIAALTALSVAAQAQSTGIAPEAKQILKASTDFLAGQQRFSCRYPQHARSRAQVRAEDRVQPARATNSVQRPTSCAPSAAATRRAGLRLRRQVVDALPARRKGLRQGRGARHAQEMHLRAHQVRRRRAVRRPDLRRPSSCCTAPRHRSQAYRVVCALAFPPHVLGRLDPAGRQLTPRTPRDPLRPARPVLGRDAAPHPTFTRRRSRSRRRPAHEADRASAALIRRQLT